jgi:hypothetical protein
MIKWIRRFVTECLELDYIAQQLGGKLNVVRVEQYDKAIEGFACIEKNMNKMLISFQDDVDKIIQDKIFAYTRDMNDIKSDYLKRYLEAKYGAINETIMGMAKQINDLHFRLEALEEPEDEDMLTDLEAEIMDKLNKEYITYKEPKD